MDNAKTFEKIWLGSEGKVGTALEGFDELEIVLRLPPAGTNFHKEICKAAVIFPFCHLGEVTKWSVDDDHVCIRADIAGGYAPKWSAVYSNLTPDFNMINQEIVNQFDIISEILRGRMAFRSAIASVIPSEDIDSFV